MNRRQKNRVVVGLIGVGMLVAIGTAVIPPLMEVSATDAGKFEVSIELRNDNLLTLVKSS